MHGKDRELLLRICVMETRRASKTSVVKGQYGMCVFAISYWHQTHWHQLTASYEQKFRFSCTSENDNLHLPMPGFA